MVAHGGGFMDLGPDSGSVPDLIPYRKDIFPCDINFDVLRGLLNFISILVLETLQFMVHSFKAV